MACGLARRDIFRALQQRAATLLVLLAGLGMDALYQLQRLVVVTDGTHLPRCLAGAAEAVLLGMRLVDLCSLVVAAVAIVAVDAVLPVDVFGQPLRVNEQPPGGWIVRILILMALEAEVVVVLRNVRTGLRRQGRSRAAATGSSGLAAAGLAASSLTVSEASWPKPIRGRANSTRIDRSVLMVTASKKTAQAFWRVLVGLLLVVLRMVGRRLERVAAGGRRRPA